MYQAQTPKQGPARATLKQARDTVPTTYRDALAPVLIVSTARDPLPPGTEWADHLAACAVFHVKHAGSLTASQTSHSEPLSYRDHIRPQTYGRAYILEGQGREDPHPEGIAP